jgi:hypothetical protein
MNRDKIKAFLIKIMMERPERISPKIQLQAAILLAELNRSKNSQGDEKSNEEKNDEIVTNHLYALD